MYIGAVLSLIIFPGLVGHRHLSFLDMYFPLNNKYIHTHYSIIPTKH